MRPLLLPCGILALLAFLGICAAGSGSEPAKSHTLTTAEIADGWILLFDGESTFGWQGDGWKVDSGELLSPNKESSLQSRFRFADFALEFECASAAGADVLVSFHRKPADSAHASPLVLTSLAPGWQKVHLQVEGVHVSGYRTTLNALKRSVIPQQKIRVPPDLAVPICLAGESLRLRHIKLKPLRTQPLFNDKDLTGWKVFPGDQYKSRFTVTEKGEIHVKDGPGDLQSVGNYQDFVLQLECLSLGQFLNSGIFFRCRAGEYQNGYEAQIRNQFTLEPTQDYLIEEYDPATHKLLAKKKIKSTAVDYGTGAIYRRQPARKEMSRDGEWFGMTIIAQGNHLGTWVNGVQVTDWNDHRPRSDNARTGCKLGAGHISIQGHDPTTDLRFRHLRIAPMNVVTLPKESSP